MSILTKIAIVVLVVVALAASVVFINLATTVPNYKYAYQQQVEETNAMRQAAVEQAFVADRQSLQYAIDRTRMTQQILAGEEKLASKIADLDKSGVDVTNLRNQIAGNEVALKDLQTVLGKEVDQRTKLDGLLSESYALNAKQGDRIREVTATSNRQAGEIERLQQLNKVRLERIAEVEDQLTLIRKELAAKGTVEGGTTGSIENAPMAEKIVGTITSVRNNLASIDVGSAKGVTKGTRFIIYRGAQLVGYLDIERVSATQAAGFVSFQKLDPQAGDRVTNKLAQ